MCTEKVGASGETFNMLRHRKIGIHFGGECISLGRGSQEGFLFFFILASGVVYGQAKHEKKKLRAISPAETRIAIITPEGRLLIEDGCQKGLFKALIDERAVGVLPTVGPVHEPPLFELDPPAIGNGKDVWPVGNVLRNLFFHTQQA